MLEPGAATWLATLESTPVAAAMRHWLWLYPIVEIVHISGFVLLVGSVAMLDLRLLGVSKGLPVHKLARHLLPWSWAGFALVLPAGLLMFSAHATDFAENPAFRLKMALLVSAGINALVFHRGVYKTVADWDIGTPAPLAAKISAALSLAIWAGVISCGRLLAYL